MHEYASRKNPLFGGPGAARAGFVFQGTLRSASRDGLGARYGDHVHGRLATDPVHGRLATGPGARPGATTAGRGR